MYLEEKWESVLTLLCLICYMQVTAWKLKRKKKNDSEIAKRSLTLQKIKRTYINIYLYKYISIKFSDSDNSTLITKHCEIELVLTND